MGQLLLKGLFITVTPLRFHPSLPSGDVTGPNRNNVAHPTKPSPSNKYANMRLWWRQVPSEHALPSRAAGTPSCVWWFCRNKMTSIKYLRRSYTEHSVHFPLCYFIDCGHNYPLFWSAALSEFPVCWTISTEGWLSRVIPQPEGTVNFPRTLIIISKPKWGKKNPQLVHLCSGSHMDWPVS